MPDQPGTPRQRPLDQTKVPDRALARAGLKVKRCGPGEIKVLDVDGREVATVISGPSRRWRVAMAPSMVRTLSSSDPTFASRRAALDWLCELQFNE